MIAYSLRVLLEFEPRDDTAYIRLTADPVWNEEGWSAMYPPSEVPGNIHLHFDKSNLLIGISLRNASSILPPELLAEAEPMHYFNEPPGKA